jgi:protein-S-isoprenylcysteine O-methyltransferase Ste14
MHFLETKIPPPVVALLLGGAMWWIAQDNPPLEMPRAIRAVAGIAIALLGGGIAVSGAHAFWRARTTLNPMRPEKTTSLVTSGIYRHTRNPIYVGDALLLAGWAAYLSSPWTLAGPVAFVLYMNRFQVAPEERALARLFGADYESYKRSVRRWL